MNPVIANVAKPREHFSLVLGGPLYQLFVRCRLSRRTLELLHRRVAMFVVVTWLPLLVLSAVDGQAVVGANVPFIKDVGAQARFLLALPLMIAAEVLVHGRLRGIVEQFRERGLIAPEDEPRFEEAIAAAGRWRNSVVAEVVMIVLSFTLGYWAWSRVGVLGGATWYARDVAGARQYTPAGLWFAFVSLPVVRFVLMRWYFRILIWYRFLWSVSRLDLRLNPLHPDRCGGLGFLAGSAMAFLPVLVAQSVLFSSVVGDRIWNAGAKLTEYDAEVGVLAACLIAVALAPMFFFVLRLNHARRAGIRRFGLLASRYVDEFERKWIAPAAPPGGEPLLGTADVQSLADLDGNFNVIREMKVLPFGKDTVVRMAVIILLPVAPLILTMIPLRDLIGKIMKMAV